jgi:hypothetical protein
MEELVKYGFVYVWFDKSRNRFYVGSHWGNPNDGYICSSQAMRDAYRRRPEDFKRRVVKRIWTSHSDLLSEEQRWIDMIKPEEFGRRYYNLNDKVFRQSWWVNEETKRQVSERIKEGVKHGKHHRPRTEEQKKRQSEQKKAFYASKSLEERKALKPKWTEEQKAKNKDSYQYVRTEAQVEATKINQQLGAKASPITKKGWVSEHRFRKHGPHKVSEEGRKRMSEAGKLTSEKRWTKSP